MLKYGSVCSGIEAATVAWHGLGWQPQWFSQYDPEWNYEKEPDFPSSVLSHHWPHVPNLGDMCALTENNIFNESVIDLLVGGTPCQSFSVAGLRKGLGDGRGNLSLEYVRLLMCKRPRWFVWENVPGVLSSGSHAENYQSEAEFSKDFACILSAFTGRDVAATQTLAKAGIIEGAFYSVAWRIFDSQYFGVPQRRRRVFVVGHIGKDWRPSAAVLFERDSLRRDFTPQRKERKGTTGNVEASTDANSTGSWWDGGQQAGTLTRRSQDQYMPDKDNFQAVRQPLVNENTDTKIFIPHGFADYQQNHVSGTLKKNGGDLGGGSESLLCIPINTMTVQGRPSDDGRMGIGIGENNDPQNTISKAHAHAVAYGIEDRIIGRDAEKKGQNGLGIKTQEAPTLTKADRHAVCYLDSRRDGIRQSDEVAPTVERQWGTGGGNVPFVQQPMILNDQGGDSINVEKGDTSPTLRAHSHQHEPVVCNTPLAFKVRQGKEGGGKGYLGKEELAFACSTSQDQYVYAPTTQDRGIIHAPILADTFVKNANQTTGFAGEVVANEYPTHMVVRRLTPLECERLQGFPDGHTDIPGASDSKRYSAIGNSMTVQVMRWIGERIQLVDDVLNEIKPNNEQK